MVLFSTVKEKMAESDQTQSEYAAAKEHGNCCFKHLNTRKLFEIVLTHIFLLLSRKSRKEEEEKQEEEREKERKEKSSEAKGRSYK